MEMNSDRKFSYMQSTTDTDSLGAYKGLESRET